MPKFSVGKFEEIVLLSLLDLGGKSYGKKIKQKIQEKTNTDPAIGAIYTTLSRLEQKGYVSSLLGEATPERGGKRKRYFKIEALGQQAVKEKNTNAVSFWNSIQTGELQNV